MNQQRDLQLVNEMLDRYSSSDASESMSDGRAHGSNRSAETARWLSSDSGQGIGRNFTFDNLDSVARGRQRSAANSRNSPTGAERNTKSRRRVKVVDS